jgi:type IV pilus assembly protein PilM
MGLFTASKIALVGIDISSTAIKLLELSRLGKSSKGYKVETYAVEPLPENVVVDKVITDVEAVGLVMKRVMGKAKPRAEHAAVAVAGSAVITKTIQMSKNMSPDELEDAVRMEAEQYIPYPMDEVSLDFEVVGPNDKNEDQLDVMLAASKTEIVDSRVAVLEIGGLKPKVVDVELFALENAFNLLAQNDPEIDSKDTIALVDVGATTTSFTVLSNAKIIYVREQAFGGKQLTERIQHHYGLSYDEAMMAKLNGSLPEDYDAEILEPFKESMAQEISRAVQFYYAAGAPGTIAHTVIAGGCASIPGIIEQISNKIGGHVTLANPFASMSVSAKVNKKALMNDAPALMIACGLALRSFD